MKKAARQARVHIETYGCQMNVYDSGAIGGLLRAADFAIVPEPAGADVVLINTCSVRDHAEQRVVSRLGELKRRRSGSEREGFTVSSRASS